jgi:hypothetical protein
MIPYVTGRYRGLGAAPSSLTLPFCKDPPSNVTRAIHDSNTCGFDLREKLYPGPTHDSDIRKIDDDSPVFVLFQQISQPLRLFVAYFSAESEDNGAALLRALNSVCQ